MNRTSLQLFDHVIHDNTFGSSALLEQIMHVFKANFGKKNLLQKDLTDVIHHLQRHFSSFAIIQHFLRYLEKALELSNNLQQMVDEYSETRLNNLKALIDKATNHVHPESTDFDKRHAPDEVWSEQRDHLEIVNRYFERIPLNLVDYPIID